VGFHSTIDREDGGPVAVARPLAVAVAGAAGLRRGRADFPAMGGGPGVGVGGSGAAGRDRTWVRTGAAAARRDRAVAWLGDPASVHPPGTAMDGQRVLAPAQAAAGLLREAAPRGHHLAHG